MEKKVGRPERDLAEGEKRPGLTPHTEGKRVIVSGPKGEESRQEDLAPDEYEDIGTTGGLRGGAGHTRAR